MTIFIRIPSIGTKRGMRILITFAGACIREGIDPATSLRLFEADSTGWLHQWPVGRAAMLDPDSASGLGAPGAPIPANDNLGRKAA